MSHGTSEGLDLLGVPSGGGGGGAYEVASGDRVRVRVSSSVHVGTCC